jgi:hypothetical protein
VKALVKQEREKMDAEKEIIKKDMKLKDSIIDQLKAQIKELESRSKVFEA